MNKITNIITIESKGVTHELNLDNKISDLLNILSLANSQTDKSEENPEIIQKYIMEINLKNGIKIKSAPRDEFLSGKTELEDLIHPYFQNKIKENENENENGNGNAKDSIINSINIPKMELELNKKDKIMVFTPHPDDEILGACGLLYKSFEKKLDIKVVYMTSGKGGGNADERKNEAISGIAKLGGERKDLIFSNLPFYTKKDRVVTEEDYNYVAKIIEENKPTSIFICADIFDPNGTHKKCFDVLMKLYSSGLYKDIKFYFYYSVWYWPKENEFSHILNYEFDTYRLKVYAMLEHKSQLVNGFMGEDPRPFYQRACARDGFYGAKYGSIYSEVYYLLN